MDSSVPDGLCWISMMLPNASTEPGTVIGRVDEI